MAVVVVGTPVAEAEVMPQSAVEASAVAVTMVAVTPAGTGAAMVAMAEVATEVTAAAMDTVDGDMAAGALASDFGPDITATMIPTLMDTRTLTVTHTVAMDMTVATDTRKLTPRPLTAAMGMVTATPQSVTADTTAAAWVSV